MKYLLFFLPMLVLSNISNATPITDTRIIQLGNEYSAISSAYQKNPKMKGWIELKDGSIYSPWARQWTEYTAYLTRGVWDIGLNVINHGYLGKNNWYNTFKVRSTLTDTALLNNEILKITASDNDMHYGLSSIDILAAGNYTVRYEWLNDKWGGRHDPQHRDANIQIQSVFFNRVPEPSSLALLLLGAVALMLRKHLFTGPKEARLIS